MPSEIILEVGPRLYAKQEAAIFDPARYVLIEASTKSGKTMGCIQWIIRKAVDGHAGQQFWWVAPVYSQAEEAYRRTKSALRDLPGIKANETALTITLPTGAAIVFRSAEKPDNLYGADVFAAVVDEASRCREEAWYALRSTLTATKAPCRIIGNVKGRRNWFYQMARKAEKGEPGMAYHRLTWRDAVAAEVLDAAEIIDARRTLPEAVFGELYDAEPSDDEGNPFGIGHIRECVAADLSHGAPVAWGWDLAKSVDWTVGVALDSAGDVCRLVRFQSPWEETIARVRSETGHALALVDSTGVGDPIVERLQREAGRNFQPFRFSPASKQQIMEGLAVAIQRRAIRFPAGPIQSELEAFEYTYTRSGVHYSAPPGDHDDCVCALALAVSLAGIRSAPIRASDIRTPGETADVMAERW